MSDGLQRSISFGSGTLRVDATGHGYSHPSATITVRDRDYDDVFEAKDLDAAEVRRIAKALLSVVEFMESSE